MTFLKEQRCQRSSEPNWYARHGHDFMGCKFPVHYLGSGHIWQRQKALAEGKGERVTDRLKEA